MKVRNLTEATEAERTEKPAVEAVHFGEVDRDEIELALDEPEVFVKAAGVDLPEDAEISVSVNTGRRFAAAERRRGRLTICRVTIIVYRDGTVLVRFECISIPTIET